MLRVTAPYVSDLVDCMLYLLPTIRIYFSAANRSIGSTTGCGTDGPICGTSIYLRFPQRVTMRFLEE